MAVPTLTKEHLIEQLEVHARDDLGDLTDDTELFSSGLIDSFAMVDLLLFLEKHTGTRLGPEDMDVDNLNTIAKILAFVASRKRR
ncbi:MAG: phosphopantetheine-binding protein [Nannocystaceae bacterium]